jgi:hypothetical protein
MRSSLSLCQYRPAAILLMLASAGMPVPGATAGAIPAPTPQIITLSDGSQPYAFAVYANARLSNDARQQDAAITRAIVLEHGVKRNGDTYYQTGVQFLQRAQLDPARNLLLVPNFMTANDALANRAMPLWRGGDWMQGNDSTQGQRGLSSLRVFDDLAAFLAAGRYPALREIIFIAHSAGAQLLQRYAVLNDGEERLKQAGIRVRYVISSPSSYLYLDNQRPRDDGFAPPSDNTCPTYNDYRYGLGNMIAYGRGKDGKQLFQRYAARDVTYLVGSKDNDPAHRFLDRDCGAEAQGTQRLQRQQNYLRYEQLLAQQWHTPVQRVHFVVPGIGHDANGLLNSAIAIENIFPDK